MMTTKASKTAAPPAPIASETGAATAPPPAAESVTEAPPAPQALPSTDDLVTALLAAPAFVDGIVAIVVTHLDVEWDRRITALMSGEDFKAEIGVAVDEHIRDDATVLPARIVDYLDAHLLGLVKLSIQDVVAINSGEVEISQAPTPIVDDASVAAATSAHEIARTDARREAEEKARDSFAAMFDDDAPEKLDLSTIGEASLLLDDGVGFSIDFTAPIPLDHLTVQDNGDVMLTHPPIAIGDDMPERFTAQGVVLVLQGNVPGFEPIAMRCELTQPILVGGGMRAQLGESSLLFRARR